MIRKDIGKSFTIPLCIIQHIPKQNQSAAFDGDVVQDTNMHTNIQRDNYIPNPNFFRGGVNGCYLIF